MSNVIIPIVVLIILIFGLVEKKEVFYLFIEGAKDGIKVILKIFPTLIAIFLCVEIMNQSGIFESLSKFLENIYLFFKIPSEIVPLLLIKPISGSATVGVASDLIKRFGVDSRIGLLAATIMSSSETTFYVIAIYLNSVKIKNSKRIFIPAILADLVSIIVALILIK